MKIVDSLSDRQIDRFIRWIAIAITVIVIALGAFYVRERYLLPNVSMVDRDLQRLTDLVIKDPDNVTNRLNIAGALYAKERYDEAIAQFNEALKIAPDNEAAIIGIGLTYAQKKQDDKALPYLERIAEMNKGLEFSSVDIRLSRVYYEIGRIDLNAGKYDEAEAALNSALIVRKTDADSFYLLGEVLLKKGELDRAEETFKYAILFVPDFIEAYQGLVQVYDKKGMSNEAGYANGMIALSKKDYDGAVRQLTQVVGKDPNYAGAYFGLGQAYEYKGQKDKAYEAYMKAAEIDPEGQGIAVRAAKKLEIYIK